MIRVDQSQIDRDLPIHAANVAGCVAAVGELVLRHLDDEAGGVVDHGVRRKPVVAGRRGKPSGPVAKQPRSFIIASPTSIKKEVGHPSSLLLSHP